MGNLTRDDILLQAKHECLKEMYAKAQPMADYDNLLQEAKEGKIGKGERIYERHYLSHEEIKYIIDKYMTAYRIKNEWYSNCEVIQDYFTKGGYKNTWVKEETDEDGNTYPGYKSYEDVKPLKEQIEDYLVKNFGTAENSLAEDITKIVMDNFNECKSFYRFDREEGDFNFSILLGIAPTSNKETVKKWWKENYNQDIEIKDKNPLLLWCMDEYGDDFEDIMREDYGDDWKEIWNKKWEETKNNKE